MIALLGNHETMRLAGWGHEYAGEHETAWVPTIQRSSSNDDVGCCGFCFLFATRTAPTTTTPPTESPLLAPTLPWVDLKNTSKCPRDFCCHEGNEQLMNENPEHGVLMAAPDRAGAYTPQTQRYRQLARNRTNGLNEGWSAGGWVRDALKKRFDLMAAIDDVLYVHGTIERRYVDEVMIPTALHLGLPVPQIQRRGDHPTSTAGGVDQEITPLDQEQRDRLFQALTAETFARLFASEGDSDFKSAYDTWDDASSYTAEVEDQLAEEPSGQATYLASINPNRWWYDHLPYNDESHGPPFWSREYDDTCADAPRLFKWLGVSRLVGGHSPNECEEDAKVRVKCEGRILVADVGMSRAYLGQYPNPDVKPQIAVVKMSVAQDSTEPATGQVLYEKRFNGIFNNKRFPEPLPTPPSTFAALPTP